MDAGEPVGEKKKRKRNNVSKKFWVCKLARVGTNEVCLCHKVMCDPCMVRWRDTGKKKGPEPPTLEEMREKEEAAKKDQQEAFRASKMRLSKAKMPTTAGRASRRSVVKNMSDQAGTVHEPDKNGCCHDDKEFWQDSEDTTYFKQKFRNRLISTDKSDKLLDMNCDICGQPIVNEGGK